MNDTTSNTPVSTDWLSERAARRAERAQYRAERRAARYAGGGAWAAGLVLIVLGAIFMLQNLGAVVLHNAWALLILLPAAGSFATAVGAYRINGGRFSAAVRGSIFSGLFFVALTAFLLLDLAVLKWWPVLLILVGVGALVNAIWPDSRADTLR